MIYKVILGKTEILIGDEDKEKIVQNIDKNFILLKSGEVINPSFVQGIVIDHEATKEEIKKKGIKNKSRLLDDPPSRLMTTEEREAVGKLVKNYKPHFLK